MTRALLVVSPVLSLSLVLAACGDDPPDITGLYMTTSHEASDATCTGGTTPDPSPPYFRMEEREILGVPYFTRIDCQDTEMASCSGGSGILVDDTDSGYSGAAYIASGDSSNCTLVYSFYDASLDGDELTYTNLNYTESGPIDPCTTDEAEARGDDMPCTSYEVIAGVRADE